MSTLVADIEVVRASNVAIDDDSLTVTLTDGRVVSVPLIWYPRLLHGKPPERMNWEWIGDGEGIHWPDLDEDISITGIILGWPSAESQMSLQRWLASRT